uniref:Putative secreted peptide n=1 Tax=Anopheles braziliensis TaxID=58242 RepID=A0A2M3ZWZ3_9DIPT
MTAFVYCSLWSTVCGASCGYTWPPPNEWQDPSSLTAASVSCTITIEVKMVSTSQQQVAAAKGSRLPAVIMSAAHTPRSKPHTDSSKNPTRTERKRKRQRRHREESARAD